MAASKNKNSENEEIVSAGGVIIRKQDSGVDVCLILRDRHGPSVWNLPKGHVEPGETIEVAALREVQEETGLNGRVLSPLATIRYQFRPEGSTVMRNKVVHYFLMDYVDGSLSAHDREVVESRWMSMQDALCALAHENERNVLQKAQSALSL